MSSDEITGPGMPLDGTPSAPALDLSAPADLSFSAVQAASADSLSATGSAIGSATAGSIDATASAIGIAKVGGDFSASFSSTPLVSVKGDASIRQSYASALVAGGTVEMSQAVAPMVAGREIHIDMGGGVLLVAGEARVKRGWIGVLLAGKAKLGEDTRVMVDTRAALIIGAALLGGFALMAVAAYFGARKLIDDMDPLDFAALSEWMPWHNEMG